MNNTTITPKTIEELKQYCEENGFTSEKTRFFIGEDYKQPRAFGIYQDELTGGFVVYKNKADGTRAIRYNGSDEAYAVGEIFQRLQEEITNQKFHYSENTESTAHARDHYNDGKDGSFSAIKSFDSGRYASGDYNYDSNKYSSDSRDFSSNSYDYNERSRRARNNESSGSVGKLFFYAVVIILLLFSMLNGGSGGSSHRSSHYGYSSYDYDNSYDYNYSNDYDYDSDWDSSDWDSGYTDWDSDW